MKIWVMSEKEKLYCGKSRPHALTKTGFKGTYISRAPLKTILLSEMGEVRNDDKQNELYECMKFSKNITLKTILPRLVHLHISTKIWCLFKFAKCYPVPS